MERLEIKTSQLLLGSYLMQFGRVEYADFEISIGRPNTPIQIKRFERKVREFLESREFDILAISCWTSLSYQTTLLTARICRELYPHRLIVVGGYHPSARPQEFCTPDNLFDYVIRGEGELALKEIMANVAGRPSRTEVVKAPTFTTEHFVGYQWDLLERLMQTELSGGVRVHYMYLSRGCPFSCSFCMEHMKDHRWRAFSPPVALAEFDQLAQRFNPHSVAFADACFGKDRTWRREFLAALNDMNPRFWVVLETRPEYLDDEDIRLLRDLKVEIQFGLESGAPEMLRLMRKTKQPERFLERFREVSHRLSDQGILHRANLIMNHPGETQATLERTFAFMDGELARKETCLMWACHGYMHFPGCELDYHRDFYEQTFGSRFISTEWWKQNQDQYENSQRFVPSRELEGDKVELWKRMLADRTEALKATLTGRAFRFAAGKYFLDWKDDPRYRQV